MFKACQTTVELYSEQRRTGQLPFDYVAVGEELQAELDGIDRCEEQVAQLDDHITEIYRRVDPDQILETSQDSEGNRACSRGLDRRCRALPELPVLRQLLWIVPTQEAVGLSGSPCPSPRRGSGC